MDTTLGIVSLISAIVGIAIGYLTFQRNRDKDNRSDAHESAIVRTKLDNIYQGVDTIRVDLKANEKQMVHLGERITRVEESSKQAHRRLDKLEGGEYHG